MPLTLEELEAELYVQKRRIEALEGRVERDERVFATTMHKAHDALHKGKLIDTALPREIDQIEVEKHDDPSEVANRGTE